MATINLSAILEAIQAERKKKYSAGLSTLNDVAKLFDANYMKGAEQTALASMEQNMTSRGLSNTTRPGALSVGIKTGLEDERRSKLSDAMTNIASYIQSETPSAGDISHLATGGFSGLSKQSQFDAQMAYQKSLVNPDYPGTSVNVDESTFASNQRNSSLSGSVQNNSTAPSTTPNTTTKKLPQYLGTDQIEVLKQRIAKYKSMSDAEFYAHGVATKSRTALIADLEAELARLAGTNAPEAVAGKAAMEATYQGGWTG